MKYIDTPIQSADFVIRMTGNDMLPLFADNDLVSCVATDAVPDGAVAALRVDKHTMIARIFFTADGYMLESDSCNTPPMYFSRRDVEIIGKPIGLTRFFA